MITITHITGPTFSYRPTNFHLKLCKLAESYVVLDVILNSPIFGKRSLWKALKCDDNSFKDVKNVKDEEAEGTDGKVRRPNGVIGESGAMPNYGESRNSRLWPNDRGVQSSGGIFVKFQFK